MPERRKNARASRKPPPKRGRRARTKKPGRDEAFESLLLFLRKSRAFDFTGYKRPSLRRRIDKRMEEVGLDDYETYREYLEVHPDEFPQLFNTILINVTAFFRDQPAWNYLQKEIIPQILLNKTGDEPIRVWSAGCSTGEETYSLVMAFAEVLGLQEAQRRLKIYGTDVDEPALAHAREGTFSKATIDRGLSPTLRDKYFVPVDDENWIFRNGLRRVAVFGRHDLTQDAPISRLDLLVCRNTLIYLNAETQNRALARMRFALRDDGFLFLGRSEMLMTHSALFEAVEPRHRFFRKSGTTRRNGDVFALAGIRENDEYPEVPSVHMRALAFEHSPWPQLLVDSAGTLIGVSVKARRAFGLRLNQIGETFDGLELSRHPLDFRPLLKGALGERRVMAAKGVRYPDPGEEKTQIFDVVVTPIIEDGNSVMGAGITFEDVTEHVRLRQEVEDSKSQLETAYEELQASNEELETTNEELQSANEELETMNEELQSANEELNSTNTQLRERTRELDELNDFFQSVLRSIRSGVVVLNPQFEVLAWNRGSENFWGLRSDEVAGEPFLGLDVGLPLEKLVTPLRSAMSSKDGGKKLAVDARDRRGRNFRCLVRIHPLLGPGKEHRGVILLMDEETSLGR